MNFDQNDVIIFDHFSKLGAEKNGEPSFSSKSGEN